VTQTLCSISERLSDKCLLSLCELYGCVKRLAEPFDLDIPYNIVLFQPVVTVSYFPKAEIIQTNPPSVFASTTSRPWLSLYRRPTARIRTCLVLLILGRLYPLGHFLWLTLCLTIIHCTRIIMSWACRRLRALYPHTQYLHSNFRLYRRLISKLLY
jgi:hypothetical protein